MAHYEPGIYECHLNGPATITKSKHKGTPGVVLRFTPAGGQYERDATLWITDKTIDRVIERLRRLGWKGDRFGLLKDHDFAGQAVELQCRHEDGYERWDFPPPATAKSASSDDATAKKLDALFGRELKKSAPALSEEEVGSVEDGDGIPF